MAEAAELGPITHPVDNDGASQNNTDVTQENTPPVSEGDAGSPEEKTVVAADALVPPVAMGLPSPPPALSAGDGDAKTVSATEQDGGQDKKSEEDSDSEKMKKLSSELVYTFMTDMAERVKTIEGNLRAGEMNEKGTGSVPVVSDRTLKVIGSKPFVRDCNWQQFKNFFSPNEAEAAIDALVLGPSDDLDEQIEEEQMRRLPADSTPELRESFEKERTRPNHSRDDTTREEAHLERIRVKSTHVLHFIAKATSAKPFPERPHTFLRPFKFLIHHHKKFEEDFALLEEQARVDALDKALKDPINPTTGLSPPDDAQTKNTESSNTQQLEVEPPKEQPEGQSPVVQPAETTVSAPQVDNNLAPESIEHSTEAGDLAVTYDVQEVYQHVKCYMDFARARLIPTYNKFDGLGFADNPKIRYDDLWSLFRPGELVFEHEDSKPKTETDGANATDPHRAGSSNQRGPRIWRIWYITTEGQNWTVNNLHFPGDLRRNANANIALDPVWLDLYQLDFDGNSYLPVVHSADLPRFDGEKDITSLPFYPVRFHKDSGTILAEYKERGQRFQKMLINSRHAMEHDGWTLSKDPVGDAIINSQDIDELPEYISSDVIIDHREALQSHPWWEPNFIAWKVWETSNAHAPTTKLDHFSILFWVQDENTGGNKTFGHYNEIVVDFDNVQRLERYNLAMKDDFIVDPSLRPVEDLGAKKKLSPEDLALLPNRLFVYSLRDRKFVNANIQFLKEIRVMSDPFKELKIPRSYKDLIRSTVQDHFTKKELERQFHVMGMERLEQDFIRSKGRGLVFLLHGPPGVGKTATAEAVAYAHRKPLFSLSCFDLGTSPDAVESRLSEIFRLANLWDCVLLLDEADIFLSHREKKDDNLQRNAIVSIFLRTMEYYPGILFLTTNRPGALDEALSSRVHISLTFSMLDYDQTIDLFRMNLKRSEKIAEQRATVKGQPRLVIRREEILEFAGDQFRKSESFWNGRVIRNAFQIAMSLAYVEHPSESYYHEVEVAVVPEITDSSVSPSGNTVPPQHTKHLGREHFERVLEIFNNFKEYRQSLFNKTDDKLAHQRQERLAHPSASSRGGNNNMGRDSRQNTPGAPSTTQPPRYHNSPRDKRPPLVSTDYGAGSGYSSRPRSDQDYYGPSTPREVRPGPSRQQYQDHRQHDQQEYGFGAPRDRDTRHGGRQPDDGDVYGYLGPQPPRQQQQHQNYGYGTPLHGDEDGGLDVPSSGGSSYLSRQASRETSLTPSVAPSLRTASPPNNIQRSIEGGREDSYPQEIPSYRY